MNAIRTHSVRGALYGGVILIALGAAYLATRGTDAPAAGITQHEHAAPDAGGDAGQQVLLTPEAAHRIGVTYAVASIGAIEKDVRTVGQIVADETRVRTISPRIDGWVERLLVDATGQSVSVGQPLLVVYSPMVVQAEEELLLARRLQQDVRDGSADAQRGATDLAASARRRLASWDIPASEVARVEQTGTSSRTATLLSPAAGFVIEKNVVAGQKIMAGQVLYTVADLRTVWIEGEVFEQDLASVRVGQTARVDLQALPGEPRTGHVAFIQPVLDADTRTVRIRVVVPNGDLRLKPGMSATLRIAGGARTGVLTVPRGAVLSTGERNIVFVRAPNGHLVPREVAVGVANDERVEVLRGLAAGETVVASATFLVDAESNLGTVLGGMGNMPGMDVSTPPTPLPAAGQTKTPPAPPAGHDGHVSGGT